MTTKTKIYIGVSVVALVGGYFIYKALKPKKPMVNGTKDDTKPKTDVPTTTTPPITNTTTTTTTTDSGECKRYIVVGVSKYVNVRSTPSTSSKEIETYPLNSTPLAKPSSTSGWMELCDMKGFISSKYLKPFVPKSTKCVLQKGLKWGGGVEKNDYNQNRNYYYQNYKDLRSGLYYTRGIETERPFEYYEGAWYRRTDNQDKGDASWCGDFLANGKLDPKCLINRRELEQLYQSGNVC